jgi:DNA-directed RNA polymerase subunit RPC12/RpoP
MNDQEMAEMAANVCPRCESRLLHSERAMDALSRRDNKTYVCSPCGEDEAVLDLMCEIAPRYSPAPNVPSRVVYEYFRDQEWPRRGRLLTFDLTFWTPPAIKETQNG